MQQPHFNTLRLDGSVPDEEALAMIGETYAVALGKLPKAAQRELRGL
ncbi:MAG: hypothetical protein LBD02_00345 [Christensenellaceae bacterium]|nr:hypothetical protein [Christensenellaceae bacterium]